MTTTPDGRAMDHSVSGTVSGRRTPDDRQQMPDPGQGQLTARAPTYCPQCVLLPTCVRHVEYPARLGQARSLGSPEVLAVPQATSGQAGRRQRTKAGWCQQRGRTASQALKERAKSRVRQPEQGCEAVERRLVELGAWRIDRRPDGDSWRHGVRWCRREGSGPITSGRTARCSRPASNRVGGNDGPTRRKASDVGSVDTCYSAFWGRSR